MHLPRITLAKLALLLVFIGAGSLGFALISQYGYGLFPCKLCLLQRYPFAALIALGALLLFLRKKPWAHWLVPLASLALLIGSGIAFYHTGVEQSWWAGASGCVAEAGAGSIEDLTQAILSSPLVTCDVPAAEFLGLSMAGWNALFSLFWAGLLLYLWFHLRKEVR